MVTAVPKGIKPRPIFSWKRKDTKHEFFRKIYHCLSGGTSFFLVARKDNYQNWRHLKGSTLLRVLEHPLFRVVDENGYVWHKIKTSPMDHMFATAMEHSLDWDTLPGCVMRVLVNNLGVTLVEIETCDGIDSRLEPSNIVELGLSNLMLNKLMDLRVIDPSARVTISKLEEEEKAKETGSPPPPFEEEDLLRHETIGDMLNHLTLLALEYGENSGLKISLSPYAYADVTISPEIRDEPRS